MRQRLIGIVTAGLGVLLLWIAVPRMVANLLLLPGNSALQLLTTGNTITLDGYDRILRSRDAALAWVELPQARIDLGETLYLMARAEDETGVDAGTALREARNQFRQGLAQAPASTRAWLWLADVNQALGDAEGAAAAVRLSLLSAPHEVNIAYARAILAFLYWDRLAPENPGDRSGRCAHGIEPARGCGVHRSRGRDRPAPSGRGTGDRGSELEQAAGHAPGEAAACGLRR